MFIQQLSIQNFRQFEEYELKLRRPFTVLFGENASGKTSLLDALVVAAGSFFLGLEVPSGPTISEEDVRLININNQPKPQLPVRIKAKGLVGVGIQEWTRSKDKSGGKTLFMEASLIKNVATQMLVTNRKGGQVVFPIITYYSTGRNWAIHEKLGYQKQEEGVIHAYKNALSKKASPFEFASWLKTIEDSQAIRQDALDASLIDAFKSAIAAIIPETFAQITAITFDPKAGKNPNLGDLLFTIVREMEGAMVTEIIRFSQLSDGYRNIISMVADIAYRCIQLNPHLGKDAVVGTSGIVIIDELDLHLHAKWQERIVADLKRTFPLMQFVATTHSPILIQSLSKEELIDLDGTADLSKSPKDMTLAKVVTDVVGLDNNRSDDFDTRYKQAQDTINTTPDFENLSFDQQLELINVAITPLVAAETNDPAYKAILDQKNEAKTNEAN